MEIDFSKKKIEDTKFAIIGLGLIGGSYAKALRQLGAKKIIVMERKEAVLQEAKDLGLVDVGFTKPGSYLAEADVVLCAIYPEAMVGFIRDNLEFFNPQMLLTDVAGIKLNRVAEMQAILPEGMEFISGHPMAGRQSSGFGMSDAAIFHGANYIIVPTEQNTPGAIAWLEGFAKALGCKNTVQVNPTEHDRTIAFTSNLPHVTAVALIGSESYNEKTKFFVAGSFRDGTRVADINPELWCDLFMANREKVADELDKYMEQLEMWRQALRSGDGEKMKKLMRIAAARRKELY